MSNRPIALQMYTLRDAVQADIVGTLRAVAELGYRAVELHTLGGLSAAELRTELDTLGIQVAGMHIALDRLEQQLDAEIAALKTLGGQYVICPFLAPDRRGSADAYRALAKSLNQIGRACQEQGMRFAYHNHAFEFDRFGDVTGFDILFGETDPALVQSELDVYWVAFAGHDPVAQLRQLKGRVPLVHLKDMTAGDSPTFAEVGHGILDFPAILAAADEAGAEWLIVEQDVCARPPLESVGMSLAYLRSIGRA
jgi:sugar phosphate isomerase/epimerase